MSNSSNSGLDLLSAWYDGADVMYKLSTPNTMTFRSTAPQAAAANAFAAAVYPNPAGDELYVAGAAGPYRILDMAGRELQRGTLETGRPVDIGAMAGGMYILHLGGEGPGGGQSIRFSKH